MWRFLSCSVFVLGCCFVSDDSVLPMRNLTLWKLSLLLCLTATRYFATWSPGVSKACRNPVDR